MSNFNIILFLVSYFVILVISFFAICKRLKFLIDRHINYTKVDELFYFNKKLVKIIFFIHLILFILITFITLKYLII